jgi:chitodextrinase
VTDGLAGRVVCALNRVSARRALKAAAAIAIGAALVAVSSDGRLSPLGSATAAGSNPPPLSQFGYAHGTVSDLDLATMRHYLDAIAKVTGPGGIVRAPLHWDPSQRTAPDWSKYDLFVTEVQSRDLVWLPEIHESHDGHYVIPGSSPGGWAEWQDAVKASAHRYGPHGLYAQAHPGFDGITRYEIWNEPNTPTGNATVNHDGSVDMAPTSATLIESLGTAALRAQAAADGWTPEVVGPALGAIDIDYLTKMHAADPRFPGELDTLSVHVYMSHEPATCSLTDLRCIRRLATLRTWLNANGGSNVHIGITEGGYSGSNDSSRPSNVMTEAVQASWGKEAIDWMRANAGLDIEFYTPYNPVDKALGYTGNNDYDYWYDNLGAVRWSDNTLKPWGSMYHSLIQQYGDGGGGSGDTAPPTAPTGLTGTSPTQNAPQISWTASTDNVGVTGYHVLRNNVQIATTTATTYTDNGAAEGGSYIYTVTAVDAAGNVSVASAPLTIVYQDATAPTVPANLLAASPTGIQPVLSWSASTDPDDPVAGYQILRDGTQVGTTATTTFTDNGAVEGGTYSYTVRAVDSHGNASAETAPVTVVFDDVNPPSVPTGLNGVSPTGSAPAFSWTASLDLEGPIAEYRVFRDGAQIAATHATSYVDTASAANGTYAYVVQAVDSHGNLSDPSQPLAITVQDTTPPSVPAGLGAQSPTSTAPLLHWTASSNPGDSTTYLVFRDGGQIGTTTSTSFTDGAAPRPVQTVAQDAFDRSAHGWGSAPTGGAYGYNHPSADGFWTTGSAGAMQLTSTSGLQALLPGARALSVDEHTGFALSKRPVGDAVRVMVVGRAGGTSDSADAYRAIVQVRPTGAIAFGIRKQIGTVNTTLTPFVSAPFMFAPGTRYMIRVQFTGVSPTTMRMKLWPASAPEPTTWGYTAADGAPALQRPGLVGVRSAANTHTSNLPLTALVDSLQVMNLDPEITYSYRVAAQDSHGNTSAQSAPISVTLR